MQLSFYLTLISLKIFHVLKWFSLMSIENQLAFNWKFHTSTAFKLAQDSRKPIFMLKKMMAEYVWDLVFLEDNPYSFIEVQTILDGVTIGGHTLFDQRQVLNQWESLKLLIEFLCDDTAQLNKSLILDIHTKVAKKEALEWGEFRTAQVGIGGTSYVPPSSDELVEIFYSGFGIIDSIKNPLEKALVYYFWGSLNQFFFDGNKRTSRVVMNYILMRSGYYYLSIPAEKKEVFNNMMVKFYDSKDATEGIKFILSCYRNWD